MKTREQILIIDDEQPLREFVAAFFEKRGYRAHAAQDVAQSKTWLSRHHPSLILCDVMMPDGNGLELCRWIRRRADLQRVPIIMMTALRDPETERDALELGALDFIRKPFTAGALADKASRFLSLDESQA